jgi:hypothetical protein
LAIGENKMAMRLDENEQRHKNFKSTSRFLCDTVLVEREEQK